AAPSWSTVGGNRNQIGDVSGAAVQAEAVHGGVHIHGAARGTEKTVPRELPPGNPNFTNRSSEIERIIAAVRNRPADPSMPFICFLNGLPGVGKSGLALKVAHSIAGDYPDGQIRLELPAAGAPGSAGTSGLLDKLLNAFGSETVPEDGQDKVRLFRSLTAGRSFLMLLEDAATAGQVDALLPNSTGALVLVTSAALADYFGRALEETRLEEEPDGALERLARCCHGMPSLARTAVSWLDGNPGRSIDDLIELLDRPGPEGAERSEEEVDDPVRAKFAALYRSLPEEAAGAYRPLGAHPATGFDRWAVAAALGRSAERTRQALAELVRTGLVDLVSARRGRYEIAAVVHRHAAAEAGAELDAGDLRRVKRGYAAYLRRRRRRRGRAEHPPLDRAEEAGRRSGAAGAGRPGGGRAVAGGEHRRRPGLLGAGRGARRARPGDAVRRGLREPPSGEGALHRRRGADGAGDRGRGRRGSPRSEER